MFESVDHVVVSVPEMQAAIAQYETILGTPVSRTGEPPGMGFTNAYFDFAGNSIELVCPTNDDGPVAKHVARTGGGMYLMSLRVDDMEATVADLRAKGVRLIGGPGEGEPLPDPMFIHPKSAAGVLVQITKGQNTDK